MSSEQYCLRWNDHRNTLLNNFERLLQNNTSVDCTLAAEGQYVKAHKVVLSACSPYLETVLNLDHEKHPIVFLKDMKFQELKAILLYVYRGEVVIPRDQLASLLTAAESLQIKGLGCGDKVPDNDKKREALIQQQQALPAPPPPQRQQLSPAVRVTEHTRVVREPILQFVDLTDERSQTPAPAQIQAVPVARSAQKAHKRTISQTPGRYKRMTYPPTAPERYVQGSVPMAATVLGAASPQGNIVPNNANQISGVAPFPIQNAAAAFANVAAAAANQTFMVQRQPNDAALHNDYIASQPAALPAQNTELHVARGFGLQPAAPPAQNTEVHVARGFGVQPAAPPVQHTEAHVARISGGQPTNYMPKVKKVTLPQRRVVYSNATQPGQDSSPSTLLSQRAPAVRGATALEQTAPSRASTNDTVGALQRTDSIAAPGPTTRSTIVQQVESEMNVLPPPDIGQSQEVLPESDQLGEADETRVAEDETLNDEDKLLDGAGPSEQESVPAASGARRGRPSGRGGDRKFKCPDCDRKFAQKCNMEKHRRVHREDSYKCDVCDRSFIARSALIKHVRTHTPGIPQGASPKNQQHKCQLCGVVCPNPSELEKHLTDHTLSAPDDSNDAPAE